MPMMEMFDRGVQLRMGHAHVKRWVDDILPLALDDADPLGTKDLATHLLPLDEAPHGYEMLQKKQVLLHQGAAHPVSGRVVVITGASSGIGRATALACARLGDLVVLAARAREGLDAAGSARRPARRPWSCRPTCPTPPRSTRCSSPRPPGSDG
jgi:hypothetical protein